MGFVEIYNNISHTLAHRRNFTLYINFTLTIYYLVLQLMELSQPVNIKATLWTIGIHALLLLLFFFISYKVPVFEQPDEMGVEVNIGTAADGYGIDQPLSVNAPAAEQATQPSLSSSASSELPTNIVESDDPDAPAVSTANNRNTGDNNRVNSNTNKPNNAPTNNKPAQKAKYVYGGGNSTGGNNANTNADGSSEGNTSGAGDRGVPGGTPGADNYEGTSGSGGGIRHTINGRNIVAYPDKDAEFREDGTVVIKVTVNRQGEIVSKRIVSAPNAQLRSIALQKVEKIRFNKSNNAPEEQFGNITFVFKTRS